MNPNPYFIKKKERKITDIMVPEKVLFMPPPFSVGGGVGGGGGWGDI